MGVNTFLIELKHTTLRLPGVVLRVSPFVAEDLNLASQVTVIARAASPLHPLREPMNQVSIDAVRGRAGEAPSRGSQMGGDK
jgi:hypothetical protein